MVVSTTTRKENFAGGQASLVFSFTALTSHPEDIKVLVTETATGTETDLVYGVGYSVALETDGVGGTVTVSPTYSTAYTYTVYRETTATQESDYEDYNQFPADTLEQNLDRLTMIAQEQAEETSRTLRYPISASGTSTELPSPLADAFLAWNSDATALENKEIPDPSTLIKASTVEAQAGTEDTHFMTPAKTNDAIQALAPSPTVASQAQSEAASSNTVFMTPLQVKYEVQKSGAVSIPIANITENASVVLTSGNQTIAGVKTFTSFPVTPSSAPTTDYQAANKKYADDKSTAAAAIAIGSIKDYGSSTSSGAAVSTSTLKICYGYASVAGASTVAISGLPFSSSTSYVVTLAFAGSQNPSEALEVTRNSASQFTIWNGDNLNQVAHWIAIGT
jgi:hypothetical protein